MDEPARAARPQRSPQFYTPEFIITCILLALAAFVVGIVLLIPGDAFSSDLKALVVGIVLASIADVRKFYLNSTRDSDKKNDTINTLVRGTGNGNGNGTAPAAAGEVKP